MTAQQQTTPHGDVDTVKALPSRPLSCCTECDIETSVIMGRRESLLLALSVPFQYGSALFIAIGMT